MTPNLRDTLIFLSVSSATAIFGIFITSKYGIIPGFISWFVSFIISLLFMSIHIYGDAREKINSEIAFHKNCIETLEKEKELL